MDNWIIEPADNTKNSSNTIFTIFNNSSPASQIQKKVISLVAGDPSKCSDFQVNSEFVDAVNSSLSSGTGNSYSHQLGPKEAREFMAQKYSYEKIKLSSDDIIFDFGGSGAIFTLIQTMLNPGDNMLVPSPGFPLYDLMCKNRGCTTKYYRLKPNENWEIDFSDLDSAVDERTKLLVIINPSNPCGSVFSREHLINILDWAKNHHICILADEVYEGLTFSKPFIPLGSLTDEVPVFSIGTMSKLCLVPGWRCGWIKIYDKYDRCCAIKQAISYFKSLVAHVPLFIANAVPQILSCMPENYSEDLSTKVKRRADIVYEKLSNMKELIVYPTEGSIYFMVLIDPNAFQDIPTGSVFVEKLAEEEQVKVLPAEFFCSSNGFRIVLCNSIEAIEESMDRIKEFVNRHRISQ